MVWTFYSGRLLVNGRSHCTRTGSVWQFLGGGGGGGGKRRKEEERKKGGGGKKQKQNRHVNWQLLLEGFTIIVWCFVCVCASCCFLVHSICQFKRYIIKTNSKRRNENKMMHDSSHSRFSSLSAFFFLFHWFQLLQGCKFWKLQPRDMFSWTNSHHATGSYGCNYTVWKYMPFPLGW